MFRLLIFLFLLRSYKAFSSAMHLKCQASYNTDVVLETAVELKQGEKNKLFGELAGLKFMVSDKGQHTVEIQAFNSYEPSRNYASARFVAPSSLVELNIWKQDYLLEVSCRN